MTTYRVEVDGLDDLIDGLGRLSEEWPHISEAAMRRALVDSSYQTEVYRRTPKSSRERYVEAQHHGLMNVSKAKRYKRLDNDPSTWMTSLKKGWQDVLPEKSLARMKSYGNQRLVKSIMGENTQDMFKARRSGRDVMISVSSSLPYAARIHEAEKPKEGQYWTPAKDPPRGWSAMSTGNKYLEEPFRKVQKDVDELYVEAIDEKLRRMGLL